MTRFVEDELDECTDIELRVTTSTPDFQIPAGVLDQMIGEAEPGVVRIQRSCEEQFAGKTLLATCTFHRPIPPGANGGTGEMVVEAAYYRYGTTFENQRYMRDCLEGGGEWDAVAEDSNEYRHARLQFHAHELGGVANRLRGR